MKTSALVKAGQVFAPGLLAIPCRWNCLESQGLEMETVPPIERSTIPIIEFRENFSQRFS